ncbi:MAG: MarR family winged helix-turn-helix transcriptional regulator [Pseudomonadota bacterium]
MAPKSAITLEHFLPYQLVVLADKIDRRTAKIARDEGDLSLSQWRVMAAIAGKAGISARDVVAATPMDKGIVSRAVASIKARGLIERRPSPDDARLNHLYLTPQGATLYDTMVDEVRDLEAMLAGIIGKPARHTLLKTLQTINKNL